MLEVLVYIGLLVVGLLLLAIATDDSAGDRRRLVAENERRRHDAASYVEHSSRDVPCICPSCVRERRGIAEHIHRTTECAR